MNVRRIIGLVMLIGGMLLFVFLHQKRNQCLELSDSGSTTKAIDMNLYAEAGNSYLVRFCFSDEETASEWASVSADISIFFNDKQIHTKQYSASSSDDLGGVKRTKDTGEICYSPTESGKLAVKGNLTKGDRWEVQMFEKTCDKEDVSLPLALIAAVVGLALILKTEKHII